MTRRDGLPMCQAYVVVSFAGDPIRAYCEYRHGHYGEHLAANRRFPNHPDRSTTHG